MLKQPKHIQHDDLFIACLSDLPLRDQKDAMERPFFALDKNGRQQEIDYSRFFAERFRQGRQSELDAGRA